MDYVQFVKPELMILVPVLCAIGAVIKKSQLKNKRIPLVLGGVGVALAILWTLATSDIVSLRTGAEAVFIGLTQGALIAGASVYANQIFKQTGKDE